MDASQIGKRAWSYAGVLRDAGLSCFEYVEQLTLLLFLKMADQLTEPPYEREPIVPPELGWKTLLYLDGAALEDQYRTSLEKLGASRGMLGVIFKGSRCEIHNPALLRQIIVNLLNHVDWLSLPVDVKGTIDEELLARSAQESSRGAVNAPETALLTCGEEGLLEGVWRQGGGVETGRQQGFDLGE